MEKYIYIIISNIPIIQINNACDNWFINIINEWRFINIRIIYLQNQYYEINNIINNWKDNFIIILYTSYFIIY